MPSVLIVLLFPFHACVSFQTEVVQVVEIMLRASMKVKCVSMRERARENGMGTNTLKTTAM